MSILLFLCFKNVTVWFASVLMIQCAFTCNILYSPAANKSSQLRAHPSLGKDSEVRLDSICSFGWHVSFVPFLFLSSLGFLSSGRQLK